MNIRDIINKHYGDFQKRAAKHNNNSPVLEPDEILDEVLITAIKKYDKQNVEEQEALQYIKRNMFMESVFVPKRLDGKTVYIEETDLSGPALEYFIIDPIYPEITGKSKVTFTLSGFTA